MMNPQTILLALLVALLAWEFVLRVPTLRLVRRLRSRHEQQTAAAAPLPMLSMTFLLCDKQGKQEYEITWHGHDAPEMYEYAGKVYTQEKRRHTSKPLDIIWEYRR